MKGDCRSPPLLRFVAVCRHATAPNLQWTHSGGPSSVPVPALEVRSRSEVMVMSQSQDAARLKPHQNHHPFIVIKSIVCPPRARHTPINMHIYTGQVVWVRLPGHRCLTQAPLFRSILLVPGFCLVSVLCEVANFSVLPVADCLLAPPPSAGSDPTSDSISALHSCVVRLCLGCRCKHCSRALTDFFSNSKAANVSLMASVRACIAVLFPSVPLTSLTSLATMARLDDRRRGSVFDFFSSPSSTSRNCSTYELNSW